jgi:hypothetical protein
MFERLIQLCDNTIKLNEGEIVKEILAEPKNSKMVIVMQQEQLLRGENSENRYLPRYIDDPFFKTKESAIRYQNWKSEISPNKDKPKGVMDFYINGKFHKSIKFENMILFTNDSISNSVENKDPNFIGLNKKSNNELGQKIIPNIIKLVKGKILSGN